MLSLLLIAALAVQTPPASKPTQDTTASKRTTTAAPRGSSQTAVSRMAFHDRMRELWADHIVYTRSFIVSASAGLADTSEVLQRLLRNQDEIGEAIKPYYGDENGTKLASLLRSHIQLAGKALVAATGSAPTPVGMGNTMRDTASTYISNRMAGDTVSTRADTTKINSQNPHVAQRMTDTTKAARDRQGRIQGDTTKAKQPNARVTGDTMSQRLPSNQATPVRQDTTNRAYAQHHVPQGPMHQQVGQVDSVQVNQAVAALKANGDSIATFLSQANPRGFQRDALKTGLHMHIDLLLKEATAHVKKDWAGSIAAYDESQRQALQMADMLSEGIMKQFPSRFTNRTTTVSSR